MSRVPGPGLPALAGTDGVFLQEQGLGGSDIPASSARAAAPLWLRPGPPRPRGSGAGGAGIRPPPRRARAAPGSGAWDVPREGPVAVLVLVLPSLRGVRRRECLGPPAGLVGWKVPKPRRCGDELCN